MAYIPTNWANGDIVTSEKVNKAEQGIKNASVIPNDVLFVEFHVTENYDSELEETTYDIECNYTYDELFNSENHIFAIASFIGDYRCYYMLVDENLYFHSFNIDFLSSPVVLSEFAIYYDNGWQGVYRSHEME